jgi:hypothetical protein
MAKSNKPYMARIIVDVPKDDLEKFRELAEQQDLSMMQLVRRCIRKELAEAAPRTAYFDVSDEDAAYEQSGLTALERAQIAEYL